MKLLRTLSFVLALSAGALVTPIAFAHAAIQASLPAADATLDATPKEIVLTFNENVETSFSAVTLKNSTGNDIELGKLSKDATNATILRIGVPTLKSGTYKVLWIAVGHDGHRRKGEFSFTVK